MVFGNPHERIAKLVASAARWQPSSSFGTLGEFLAGNLHRLLHDGIAAIGSEVEKGFEHLLTARGRIEGRIYVEKEAGARTFTAGEPDARGQRGWSLPAPSLQSPFQYRSRCGSPLGEVG